MRTMRRMRQAVRLPAVVSRNERPTKCRQSTRSYRAITRSIGVGAGTIPVSKATLKAQAAASAIATPAGGSDLKLATSAPRTKVVVPLKLHDLNIEPTHYGSFFLFR